MTLTQQSDPPVAEKPRRRIGSVEVLAAVLVLVVLFRGPLTESLSAPALQTWLTVFVSVMTQAIPFLVFGVVLSAVIAVFVPPSFFARALPKHPALAVPTAGVAGVVLPGCECASVPVAGALVRRGVTPAAAFAFLLASPAVNPIVLVSTAVAFPGQPRVVIARALASLVVACLMGWLWQAFGKGSWLRMPSRAHLDGMDKWPAFWASVRHDVLHAGGFLVIGAASAAVIAVVVPKTWLAHLAADPFVAIVVLGLLAVLLSICSEADAFVAASLTQFSMTARLAFMVVGPMIDLKLFAMQAGIFGRGFALRFAPATFVLAIGVSAVVGTVLL
ncbi:permease [Dactylosporangium aurantiacum]|uniref:permease n=1 Tax=Dactylosporangium aurantiacum TaxID=35754 RepID=UPI000525A591|nr:permease [Dactylosporangium aurantiacum]MDG6102131.1 permease [Dactylosporangium aurantiacum]